MGKRLASRYVKEGEEKEERWGGRGGEREERWRGRRRAGGDIGRKGKGREEWGERDGKGWK